MELQLENEISVRKAAEGRMLSQMLILDLKSSAVEEINNREEIVL